MRSYLISVRYILIGGIINLATVGTAYSIELIRSVTIGATDTALDGQDLIVNGSTLTIDGSHQFNSIQLINGAVLTHSLSPATQLELTSNTIFIDASSSIDISGKGHLPNSAVTGASGGSYGGRGGVYETNGTTNPVFGSATLPTDFGIGGIGSAGKTYGGGSIKLTTSTLTLNGHITANGQNFNTFFSSQGGGSGGSILINAGTLEGTGTIEASGGSGFTFYGGGGGGGGRIAVYYDTSTFDLQNNIINLGGVCKPLFGEYGQNGSIYIEKVTAANQPPVVSTGNALAVKEQTSVTLAGSATDVDGVISRYFWTQLSGPAVNIINANTATASFIAPIVLSQNSPTILQFRMTAVDDQGASSSAETSIGVFAINTLPISNAGTDFTVNEASIATLKGSGSDSDGSIIRYQWTQTSGSTVTLSNNSSASATFTTPVLKTSEQLGFRLTVTDNELGIHSDDIIITVNPVNIMPVARIIHINTIDENTLAQLNGYTSSDSDGSIIKYQWTQVSGPAVILSNTTQAIASFITPLVYQNTAMSFRLTITDDEGGTSSSITQFTVLNVNPDDDIDGMLDTWEMLFFNTLTHDGTADTDGDGATDLEEYNFGTDPTAEQQPAQPEIVTPDDTEVSSQQPELILTNPKQHTGFPVSYEFEVYQDATMTNLVTSARAANLNWIVDTILSDNTVYYWRARAVGATLYSAWVSSQFFVNIANDAPGSFNISSPRDGVWVSSFTPVLSVTNSVDIDGDALSYTFEIYADNNLVAASDSLLPGSNGTTSWTVNIPLLENNLYHWRAIATDEHGLSTISSSEPVIFINTINDTPSIPVTYAPADASEITTLYADLHVNNSIDPEGSAVYYLFELDKVNTFDSSSKLSSDAIAETSVTTGWSVNGLDDNTWYYWRTKTSDGLAESAWSNGRFFVNQFNDAPGITAALNPGDNAWTGNLQPTLEVYPAIDIDGDTLSYEFNIYNADPATSEAIVIATGISESPFWQISTPLMESGYYYWHARAIDEHGLAGDWGRPVMFFADNDGINDTPTIQIKKVVIDNDDSDKDDDNDEEHNNIENSLVEINWSDYDPDSNASISLYYDTDQSGEDGTLITFDIIEDPDGDSDRYLWDISQIPAGVYYIYAIIDDGNSSSIDYSDNAIVIGDGGGMPYMAFKTPETENDGKRNQRAMIAWRDLDSNSNASISLYYDNDNTGFDGTLIANGFAEDSNGNDDHFLWDISTIDEGRYYIYGIISDETHSYRVYSDQPLTVEHHGRNEH
ncbi:MAG: thrombospondin type 3 repeat-containing protein [Gammaproteobacteria bacterium]|nr:thrombospondin type 3 repeat-containing protein [Gammaproteobacteria bacterium]